MTQEDFRATLVRAREELAEKMRQREEIETRIAQLKRIIAGVSDYVDESEETEQILDIQEPSLKGAIRTALRAIGKPATATDVREMLKELHFPIDTHSNPIGSIFTVLKRLVGDGEVGMGPPHQGKATYMWILPKYGAPNSLVNQMEDMKRDKERRSKKR